MMQECKQAAPGGIESGARETERQPRQEEVTRFKEEQRQVLAEKEGLARETERMKQEETAKEREQQERGKSRKRSGEKQMELDQK